MLLSRCFRALLILSPFYLVPTFTEAQATTPRSLFSRVLATSAGDSSPALRSHRVVSVDQTAAVEFKARKQIRLNLPSGSQLFKATNRKQEKNGREVISGKLANKKGEVLGVFKDNTIESLSVFDYEHRSVWTLLPKDGKLSLSEYDVTKFPACGGAPEASSLSDVSSTSSTTPQSNIAADGTITIDVMIVWTPQASQANGGTAAMEAIANQAVAAANQAYANSQVFQRLNLVYAGPLAESEPSDLSESTQLSWLLNKDGHWDEAHSIREQVGADLVTVFTNNATDVCGKGYLLSSTSGAYGFSAVQTSCAVGNLSYAHELGHNMGSLHDSANSGGATGAYSYSYGWRVPGVFRTVMSYSSSSQGGPGEPRLAFFSNPEVSYNGTATGTNTANNALSLNNTAPIVAAFRNGGAGQCTPAAPTLSFSPTSKSSLAGTSVSYTVSVTNRDSSSCLPATFTLNSTLPANWIGSFESNTVTVGPGALASTNLTITSPVDAAVGTVVTLPISAIDSTVAAHIGSGSVSYSVVAPDTTAPTAPKSLTASVKRRQVSLKWLASTDNVAVAKYLIIRSGVTIGTTTSLSYTDRSAIAGTSYSYSVSAQDLAGNTSATSNVVTLIAK